MTWKEFSSSIWTFDLDEHKVLEGKFAGWDSFDGGDFGACNRYFVDHETYGRVSFIGGSVFDKMFTQADVLIGESVRVEYGGKKDLKDGRKVNLIRLFVNRVEDVMDEHPSRVKPHKKPVDKEGGKK